MERASAFQTHQGWSRYNNTRCKQIQSTARDMNGSITTNRGQLSAVRSKLPGITSIFWARADLRQAFTFNDGYTGRGLGMCAHTQKPPPKEHCHYRKATSTVPGGLLASVQPNTTPLGDGHSTKGWMILDATTDLKIPGIQPGNMTRTSRSTPSTTSQSRFSAYYLPHLPPLIMAAPVLSLVPCKCSAWAKCAGR